MIALNSHPYAEEKGGLTTIWEGFQRGVAKHPKSNCLGTRKYEGVDEKKEYKKSADGLPKRGAYVWESYEQVDALARAFGSGMIELGAKPKVLLSAPIMSHDIPVPRTFVLSCRVRIMLAFGLLTVLNGSFHNLVSIPKTCAQLHCMQRLVMMLVSHQSSWLSLLNVRYA